MTLDDVVAALSAIVKHPCYCNMCKISKRTAQQALLEAPGAEELMKMDQTTASFRAAEQEFRDKELIRLSGVLTALQHSRCEMNTVVEPLPKTPTRDQVAQIVRGQPVIPDLPQETPSERMRAYAAQLRQASIEMKKNPRIPGTFIIK